jgi:aspartyl-tRNA(Asn)/glutamyl-tRNA(Gln) amidotransferase subunit A
MPDEPEPTTTSRLPTRRDFLAASAAATAGLTLKRATAESKDLAGMSLQQATGLIRSKAVSPVELTRACLARIERSNGDLNAFITVIGEQALADARAMEAEQARGRWRGPLHGIPIALKDNVDTAGVRSTAASELFKNRVPTEDAEVVRRLRGAGAVLLGKLNMHEFAYGGTSAVSYFGAVHNPWALDRIAGGSSGGSAAATAADLCFGALGTDTMGSIRLPSSYCGVVGLKPTYGRVSLRGIVPLSWTLDHVGPICRTVEDCALMLGVIAGHDAQDPASMDVPVPDYSRALGIQTSALRLGIARAPFFEGLDAEVAAAVEAAIATLRRLTKEVADVQLPRPADIVTIMRAEAYAYHAQWITESPEKYQPLTRERLLGAADLKAAAYAEALRETDLQRRKITQVFSKVDLLITPTMMRTADDSRDIENFEETGTRNTSPFDAFGLPAITLPCGFSRAGLPIGLQISGPPFAEATVLALAYRYERETAWHTRRPKVTSL